MTYHVFISYATGDREVAEIIRETLESGGLKCWIAPRDVVGNYGAAIINGIESSKMMVLVFSSHANESSFVHREVERAAAKNATIYVVRLEDVPAVKELELFISSDQWFDATTSPLGERREELLQKVRQRLGEGGGRVGVRRRPWLPQLTKAIKPLWDVRVIGGIILLLIVWKLIMPLSSAINSGGNRNTNAVATPTPLASPERTPTPINQGNSPTPGPSQGPVVVLPSPAIQSTPAPTPTPVESLEHSQWLYQSGNVKYVWQFLPNGVLRARHEDRGTFLPNGRWKQDGDTVTIETSISTDNNARRDDREVYQGKIQGNTMKGKFLGLDPYDWVATRQN